MIACPSPATCGAVVRFAKGQLVRLSPTYLALGSATDAAWCAEHASDVGGVVGTHRDGDVLVMWVGHAEWVPPGRIVRAQ